MTPPKRILFPVDFSDRCKAVAPFVLSMARRSHATVILLHAIHPIPPLYAGMNTVYPETYDFTGAKEDFMVRLREFADTELPKVPVEILVELGDAASVIVEAAAEHSADLITMPTHGYGPFRRLLLGSVTAKVLHDAKVPVWTSAHAEEASHRAHPTPRHIVTALDLKDESKAALDMAIGIAEESGATIEMVHVAREGEISPDKPENDMREMLAEAAKSHPETVHLDSKLDLDVVEDVGNIAKLVRSVAIRKRADLVVIGRGVIQGPFGGFRTNAYAIIRESPCPVLSV